MNYNGPPNDTDSPTTWGNRSFDTRNRKSRNVQPSSMKEFDSTNRQEWEECDSMKSKHRNSMNSGLLSSLFEVSISTCFVPIFLVEPACPRNTAPTSNARSTVSSTTTMISRVRRHRLFIDSLSEHWQIKDKHFHSAVCSANVHLSSFTVLLDFKFSLEPFSDWTLEIKSGSTEPTQVVESTIIDNILSKEKR